MCMSNSLGTERVSNWTSWWTRVLGTCLTHTNWPSVFLYPEQKMTSSSAPSSDTDFNCTLIYDAICRVVQDFLDLISFLSAHILKCTWSKEPLKNKYTILEGNLVSSNLPIDKISWCWTLQPMRGWCQRRTLWYIAYKL